MGRQATVFINAIIPTYVKPRHIYKTHNCIKCKRQVIIKNYQTKVMSHLLCQTCRQELKMFQRRSIGQTRRQNKRPIKEYVRY